MNILGIDTSCDDTSVAIVSSGRTILSNIVAGQEYIHSKFGGVVPELASRRHIEVITNVTEEALLRAKISLNEIDAIAVCKGPGLIGSLLVGCSFAKGLSYTLKKPLIAVNHIEGHILSPLLEPIKPEFPYLAIILSGGHSSIFVAQEDNQYYELGRTRDDAAGEAFDKVSKLLGFGYPGGPIIDKISRQGNPEAINFPRAFLPKTLDFSFSGLKTAVLNHISNHTASLKGNLELNESDKADIAASFQSAVIDVVIKKIYWATQKTKIRRVALSGGVSANSELRKKVTNFLDSNRIKLFLPSPSLCTDNAAMIAAAGYPRFLKKDFVGYNLNPQAYLRI